VAARKWINIFLSLWLINAVVCFHAPSPLQNSCEPHEELSQPSPNTLVDWVADMLAHPDADDDGDETHHHFVRLHSRYLGSRTLDFNLQVPTKAEYSYQPVPQIVKIQFSEYWLTKAYLPRYYNFLFRLSPF
jgi:hypothetical protein